ncbi:MAG TPA: 2-oxoacid:ferredoxin oxidoreductase subunit beta [Thermoanaerobaculia bacterium]|nr:2-oxoacid:ferredoxin oxidoreductase subunit beta [Thermoanaerobaculia bacterium]
MAAIEPLTIKDMDGRVHPDWCPGCGDFGVLKSLKEAILALGIAPHDVLVVSGIGCSSNLPGFIHAYGVHSLHGRALPVASGAALANSALHVVAVGGDGDGYGIGIGHFIHAMRRNLNLTYIVMDNEVYGLTTGQTSPTTLEGHKTKSTPRGNVEKPINPMALALVAGATYVARGFSAEQKHLTGLVRDAIAHRGFSLIDVFSPCVTFNHLNTYAWFKERIYKLDENGGHDSTDLQGAIGKSLEFDSRIPIGCLYKADKPIYDDSDPVLQRGPLVDQPLGLNRQTFDQILAETM